MYPFSFAYFSKIPNKGNVSSPILLVKRGGKRVETRNSIRGFWYLSGLVFGGPDMRDLRHLELENFSGRGNAGLERGGVDGRVEDRVPETNILLEFSELYVCFCGPPFSKSRDSLGIRESQKSSVTKLFSKGRGISLSPTNNECCKNGKKSAPYCHKDVTATLSFHTVCATICIH